MDLAEVYVGAFEWHSFLTGVTEANPDSKVHGANMGPIWGRQDPGGPHIGPTNFAIWEAAVTPIKYEHDIEYVINQD